MNSTLWKDESAYHFDEKRSNLTCIIRYSTCSYYNEIFLHFNQKYFFKVHIELSLYNRMLLIFLIRVKFYFFIVFIYNILVFMPDSSMMFRHRCFSVIDSVIFRTSKVPLRPAKRTDNGSRMTTPLHVFEKIKTQKITSSFRISPTIISIDIGDW